MIMAMLGDAFSLHFSESAGSSNSVVPHSDHAVAVAAPPTFSLDPLKAERLEQRLTASASVQNLLEENVNNNNNKQQLFVPSSLIAMEEEELASEEEVCGSPPPRQQIRTIYY